MEDLLQNDNVDINAMNSNGQTAKSLYEQIQPKAQEDSGIAHVLCHGLNRLKNKHKDTQAVKWLTKKRDSIMVVAILIATMAFQAGVTPPGGVWQEDFTHYDNGTRVANPHKAGEAVMAYKSARAFKSFMRTNTVAFVTSLSTILLLISGLPFKRPLFMWILMVIMWVTVTMTAATYAISITVVTPRKDRGSLSKVIGISLAVWCGVMGVLLVGNTIRLFDKWLKNRGVVIWRPKRFRNIVEYLIDNTRIENGARNAAGLTALDLLLQNPGDLRDLEIKQCLEHQHNASSITNRNAASQSSKKSIKPSSSKLSTNMQPKKHKHTDWLGRKRSAVMIVASLTATVAFQAGLSPPGGVWQGDFAGNPNGTARADRAHKAGQSVMAYTLPDKYGQYMVFNTIAFLASLSIILLQVSGLPMRRRRWMWTQMVTMWIAISAQTLTYFVTLINMTPKHVENTVYHVARVSVILWLVLMAVVFIGNMTRAVLYVMRKYGYAEEKEREVIVYEEEEDEL
ncbi:hypothetical protein SASPL_127576 [Salvia splendens]|uniref:PGG domain-containing protein n=1 Tax=Salvia splendens TaxID=180675 RepID=A0A8X8X9G3_SALSN|nr:hypothetical protein SASPL_127576 [Salvia splendens]